MDSTLLARVWADSGENTLEAESLIIGQIVCDIENDSLILTGNFKGQLEGWREIDDDE